jgi:basic membrane protein A
VKRWFHFLAIIALLLMSFASVALAGEIDRVALVTDVGKVDDKTFNEFAYKGMLRAGRELNLKTAFIETQQPTDYEKNIEQFIAEGYKTIVTVGFMLGDATAASAKKHPDARFIIVDFAYDPPLPNVMGLVFAEDQAGFLAGALAGMKTKSKTVGIVAGKEIPPVIRYLKGYQAGVHHVCATCQVLSVHIDSFTDPARGKTAALSQIDEGADVIFGAGGLSGSGAILGASQAGVYVIGVDQDEYRTTFKDGKEKGADKVLSSAMKMIDVAVFEGIKEAYDGTFKGRTRLFDAAGGGVGLAPFHEAENVIPSTARMRLNEILEGLRSGTVKTGVK